MTTGGHGLNIMRETAYSLADGRDGATRRFRTATVSIARGLAACARMITSVSHPLITLFGVFAGHRSTKSVDRNIGKAI